METLVIIGMRSGSVGVRHKNIRDFCGFPLFYWVLLQAKKAITVDRVVISTDSNEYVNKIKEYHSDIILRPSSISESLSTDYEYLSHTLRHLEATENYIPDIVIRSVVTNPFQLSKDFDECVKLLNQDSSYDSVQVISKITPSREKLMQFSVDNKNNLSIDSNSDDYEAIEPLPRQNAKQYLYKRSNLIATRISCFDKSNKKFCGSKIAGIEIPSWRGYDIDTEQDFLTCKLLMAYYLQKGLLV